VRRSVDVHFAPRGLESSVSGNLYVASYTTSSTIAEAHFSTSAFSINPGMIRTQDAVPFSRCVWSNDHFSPNNLDRYFPLQSTRASARRERCVHTPRRRSDAEMTRRNDVPFRCRRRQSACDDDDEGGWENRN